MRKAAAASSALVLLLLFGGGAVNVSDALATPVAIILDTTTLAGTPATLEFDLFGFDGTDGNNTVVLTGSVFGSPAVLTDTGGLGQVLIDTVLGASLSFAADFAPAFDGLGTPDRFAFFLLDPVTSFSLVDTDLEGDALVTVDLLDGRIVLSVAGVTTPNIPITVPAAASLLLLALGVPALWAHRPQPAPARRRLRAGAIAPNCTWNTEESQL